MDKKKQKKKNKINYYTNFVVLNKFRLSKKAKRQKIK